MADDEPRDSPPWRARWGRPSPSPPDLPEEEAREDAALAETLGAFSTLPLLDGVSDAGDPAPAEEHFEEGETAIEGGGSRSARLVGWMRWAAAPLGFLLFLSALTAYGVLRDRESGDSESSARAPAAATSESPSTASASTTTPTTGLVEVPTTALSEFSRVTTTLLSPPASASPTSTVAPTASPRAGAATATTSSPGPASSPAQTTAARARYFGPACGHSPGQAVPITIDGRRERAVIADANGCVSFTYYGPVCGYTPGDRVDLVINGRPELPVTAGPDGCVSALRE